jgi:threonine aldolase
MNFASDNVTGVSPAVLEAIRRANEGPAPAYGDDGITAALAARFAELFEHQVTVFPVSTGTAANSLALAAITPPWGAVLCHEEAHIAVDEANAPEFYTGGAKLALIPGDHGKIAAEAVAARLPGGLGVVHHAQPAAVSLTQATEAGTVYRPGEIAAIAEIAHGHGLKVHMDGARFANALVHLGASPSEATWRSGVDILSFGATKNGAMAAEAILCFDPELALTLAFRRKRAGHLVSKMRFLSAQLEGYLAEDLWLRNARHANAQASRLAGGLEALPGTRLVHPVQANEIFVDLPERMIVGLLDQGFRFYRWTEDTSTVIRLVTAFDTEPTAVDAFLKAAAALSVL